MPLADAEAGKRAGGMASAVAPAYNRPNEGLEAEHKGLPGQGAEAFWQSCVKFPLEQFVFFEYFLSGPDLAGGRPGAQQGRR